MEWVPFHPILLHSMRWQWFFLNRDLSLKGINSLRNLINRDSIVALPATPLLFSIYGTKGYRPHRPIHPRFEHHFLSGRQYWYHLLKTKTARKWCFWGEIFSSNHGKALLQIKSHLITKNTNGSGACTVRIFQRRFPLCVWLNRGIVSCITAKLVQKISNKRVLPKIGN